MANYIIPIYSAAQDFDAVTAVEVVGQTRLEELKSGIERRDGRLWLQAHSFRNYPSMLVGENTTVWGIMARLAREMLIE